LSRGALRAYAGPGVLIGAAVGWLVRVNAGPSVDVAPEALIRPLVALVALTGAVGLAMVFSRNIAVLLGRASVQYFADYKSDAPDERIERPARAFNNLMQVPILFYVACILMLVTRRADHTQLTIAWTFVVLRALHAAFYIAVNYVPYRFALWLSSCIALGVLWVRFALS
jgi:hypothetical protein